MTIDITRNRADLLTLGELARRVRRNRRTLDSWWKEGLVDPCFPGKRIKLETRLDGSERVTTMTAYDDFCRRRDAAAAFGRDE